MTILPARRPMFLGTYRWHLDVRGRVRLPTEWHQQVASTLDSQICILAKPGWPLKLLTEPVCRTELAAVESTLSPDADADELRRAALRCFSAGLGIAKVDSRGQLKIPAELLQVAGLKHEVVAMGMLLHAELWSPEQHKAEETARPANFEEIARRLGL